MDRGRDGNGDRNKARVLIVRGAVLAVVFVCLVMATAGTVTAQDTVDVADVEDLQAVSDAVDGEYVLVDDIDASGVDFEPIGDDEERFTGTFDGDGHVITGLTVNRPDEEHVGMFGYVGSEGTVTEVGLEDVEVTGGDSTGGLVGRNGGTVSRSHTTGAVEGGNNVGGLVGRNVGDIDESYTTAEVNGEDRVGGLVGRNVGDVDESYAAGTATGNSDVGGVVGSNAGEITDSYSQTEVEGTSNVGGVVGSNVGGTVLGTYTAGKVGTAPASGGLVGRNTADIAESYWDTDATGQASSDAGTELTTEQMTGSDVLVYMDALSFEETWEHTDGYPALAWEIHGYETESEMSLPPVETGDDDDTDEETDDYEPPGEGLPGFTVVAALVAVLAGAALVRSR